MTRDGALQLFDDFSSLIPENSVPWRSGPINRFQIMDMVAPFWCNIGSAGAITYGSVDSTTIGADALFAKANNCVRRAFPLMTPRFQSSTLLIVTWSNVESADGGSQVCLTIKHVYHIARNW